MFPKLIDLWLLCLWAAKRYLLNLGCGVCLGQSQDTQVTRLPGCSPSLSSAYCAEPQALTPCSSHRALCMFGDNCWSIDFRSFDGDSSMSPKLSMEPSLCKYTSSIDLTNSKDMETPTARYRFKPCQPLRVLHTVLALGEAFHRL